MKPKDRQISQLLNDVECSLRAMNLWSEERPSPQALASVQPFCVDTLNFEQWLQFVFIERMQFMIDEGLPLPTQCGLAPMAEENFRGCAVDPTTLIDCLKQLDQVLSS
ncbi:MAG: YqcC family protein [Cellvibrionaceae bacterium]